MPFDQTAVTSVAPPSPGQGQLYLSWTGTLPLKGWWQIYVGGLLSWTGTRTNASIQGVSGPTRIDIGAVGPTERYTDFSASLNPPPNNRATLNWLGGTFEGADIAGWNIYLDSFGGVGYGEPLLLGSVAAVEAGVYFDGFGLGGFGQGGFGASAGSFSWTSEPLTSGTWGFAVVPYDAAGNEGIPAGISQLILVAPAPPAIDTFGNRLEYSFDPSTHTPTLTWLASPG